MYYTYYLRKFLVRCGLARYLPGVQRLTGGGGAFLHYYSDRVLATPLADLGLAAAHLEPPSPDFIDLTLGAPRFDLVPSGSTRLPADRRGWPPPGGLAELRAAVAEALRPRLRLAINPLDEVLITPGASGAYATVLDTFVNPGDRVVLLDPTSPLHILGARSRRARIRWLPCRVEDGRLRFRLDHLANVTRRAKLIVLASPHNPTGGVIAPEDLEQLAWWADRRDALLVSDESFERFDYGGTVSRLGALPKARSRAVTLGGVSQGYALASARVGWLAGHRHLVRPCAATAALQAAWVPALSQTLALAALRQPEEAFAPRLEEFAARRQYGYERLVALGLDPAWPAGGFFLWVPVKPSGKVFAEQLLQSKKVQVSPGGLFGPGGAGHVRLSFAAEDGRWREGLGRLADFLRGHALPLAA